MLLRDKLALHHVAINVLYRLLGLKKQAGRRGGWRARTRVKFLVTVTALTGMMPGTVSSTIRPPNTHLSCYYGVILCMCTSGSTCERFVLVLPLLM